MEAVESAEGGLADGEGRLFRFPSNRSTPELVAAVREMGASVASVDFSPEDWRGSAPEETLERLRKVLNGGDRGVVLLHDSQPNTVRLLPMVLDEIEGRGGRFVRLVAKGPARHD